MFKVLVADDEVNIRNLIKLKLSGEGYDVVCASDGNEALSRLYSECFDICIVDVMMPVMDGFSLVKQMRGANINTPVIMVTAKGNAEDKIEGFRSGIDDYMVKPVDFEELSLRIKALLRRYRIATERKITVGGTVLTYDTLTVSNEKLNLTVTLQKKEFLILYKLFSYPEKTFSKGQLYDEFWGLDNFGDVDAVKVYVSKIRSAIEPFSEIDIATVRGIGYRGIKNE